MMRLKENMNLGCLYIVATPIGNLDDMSFRAVDVLKQVDIILAEDTRHSKHLLVHYEIDTPLRAFHEHNEVQKTQSILQELQAGKHLALISDAGTPLISDPGYVLVREAKAGTLTSIAAVVLRNDEADYAMEMSDLTTLETIGALEALKMELLNIT